MLFTGQNNINKSSTPLKTGKWSFEFPFLKAEDSSETQGNQMVRYSPTYVTKQDRLGLQGPAWKRKLTLIKLT